MTATLSDAEIGRLVDRLVRLVQPERIILFGSYAKGGATPSSDVDLLVVTHHDGRRWSLSDVQPFVARSVIPVDVHFATSEEVAEYAQIEHCFLHSVLRSGRTVYDRTSWLPQELALDHRHVDRGEHPRDDVDLETVEERVRQEVKRL